jgi:putative cell wall-binding protein
MPKFTARFVAGFVAVVLLAVGISISQPASPAAAFTASEFKPGHIINDSLFYDAAAMTQAEIQQFLDAKIGTCSNGQCLNVLSVTATSREAVYSTSTGGLICKAFSGGELSAAAVIYRAQVACGISAKVILVTLQKEQALVTSKSPSSAALARAMGMACPDTAPCATYALGFANQVYLGTKQLNTYKVARFAKQPGVQAIDYHPNSSCGSSVINVENYATAALYSYTPYQPNSAALANLGGTGNSCSSYGNRNFWNFYYTWFGSPTDIKPAGVTVSRIGGATRIETAVDISKQNFDATTDVVYIAYAGKFPDALSVAPAAALQDGPLLLVFQTIPTVVRDEIVRLSPSRIVVVGSNRSVSDAIFAQLSVLGATVERWSGANRYETSRAIVTAAFPTGVDTVYLASGSGFADAMSASAVAASSGKAVVLVDGGLSEIDTSTRDLFVALGVTKIVIAGSAASISVGIENSLRAMPAISEIIRYGGKNRYETANLINRASYSTADTVYFASGKNYPDGLAGSVVAGKSGSPLYLVPGNCVYRAALEDVVSFGVTESVILGSTASIGEGVASWANCR